MEQRLCEDKYSQMFLKNRGSGYKRRVDIKGGFEESAETFVVDIFCRSVGKCPFVGQTFLRGDEKIDEISLL